MKQEQDDLKRKEEEEKNKEQETEADEEEEEEEEDDEADEDQDEEEETKDDVEEALSETDEKVLKPKDEFWGGLVRDLVCPSFRNCPFIFPGVLWLLCILSLRFGHSPCWGRGIYSEGWQMDINGLDFSFLLAMALPCCIWTVGLITNVFHLQSPFLMFVLTECGGTDI